jgi:adenylate cyclase
MEQRSEVATVLLADVAGSTPLYESLGNVAALAHISNMLDQLETIATGLGGEIIRSKGDDILCIFADAAAAVDAARLMLNLAGIGVSIHIGLHHGDLIRARDDVFGDVVNGAARLASKANPGEALVAGSVAAQLTGAGHSLLRPLGQMLFKGVRDPMLIYKLSPDGTGTETRFMVKPRTAPPDRQVQEARPEIVLRHNGVDRICCQDESLSIGRSPDCDLVLDRQWVSRHHAVIANSNGKVMLVERSSSGTYLTMGGEREMFIRREDVMLIGEGRISLGRSGHDAEAEPIQFEVRDRLRQG